MRANAPLPRISQFPSLFLIFSMFFTLLISLLLLHFSQSRAHGGMYYNVTKFRFYTILYSHITWRPTNWSFITASHVYTTPGRHELRFEKCCTYTFSSQNLTFLSRLDKNTTKNVIVQSLRPESEEIRVPKPCKEKFIRICDHSLQYTFSTLLIFYEAKGKLHRLLAVLVFRKYQIRPISVFAILNWGCGLAQCWFLDPNSDKAS